MGQFNQYAAPQTPLTGQESVMLAQTQSGSPVTVTATASQVAGAPPGIYTVATLPSGVQGMRAVVTDATSPTFLGALTGGGSTVCPALYNGSSWVAA